MSNKENYIVINGVRYDLVPDSDQNCYDCDLFDKCLTIDADTSFCTSIFDCRDSHFEIHV